MVKRKQTKRVYEPLAKVIITDPSYSSAAARIGYVVEDRKGSTGLYGDGRWMVRVSTSLEDAQEHHFKLVNYDYVMPYTDVLWQAFERLETMAEEIRELYATLRKGIIPPKLTPVVQGTLFSKENADT